MTFCKTIAVFLLLQLLALPSAWVMGQKQVPFEIQGYLVDSETEDPWVGVTVNLEGYGVGAITDEHGKFVLTLSARPQTDQIFLRVRGIEVGDQTLKAICPTVGIRLDVQFKVMNYLRYTESQKAVDGDGKRGGYGGHGGHGEDFGPFRGHGIQIKPSPPMEYYVDREGVVWRIGY